MKSHEEEVEAAVVHEVDVTTSDNSNDNHNIRIEEVTEEVETTPRVGRTITGKRQQLTASEVFETESEEESENDNDDVIVTGSTVGKKRTIDDVVSSRDVVPNKSTARPTRKPRASVGKTRKLAKSTVNDIDLLDNLSYSDTDTTTTSANTQTKAKRKRTK